MSKKKPTRWAVCRKKSWKVIITYATKEQAENSIRGQENLYEIREVIA